MIHISDSRTVAIRHLRHTSFEGFAISEKAGIDMMLIIIRGK